jgi:D-aspartate ligase
LAKYDTPAVIIGGGVTGLGVVRDLGRNGVNVYCVLHKRDEVAYSKYCKRCYVFPGVIFEADRLMTFLSKLERSLDSKAVLFPVSDIASLNLASFSDKSDKYVALVPDKSVLETLVIKKKFYRSLAGSRLTHPFTLFHETSGDLDSIDKISAFPVLVKPSLSQAFAKEFRKKAFIAYSRKELFGYLNLADRNNIDVMIQEIVPGPPTEHYLIDGFLGRNSEPLGLFARRRLRMWPLSCGNSTVCVSIPLSEVESVKDHLLGYLKSIRFRGIFSAEFKKDTRDGVWKILEVNARSFLYSAFSSACGVNLVLMAYLEAIGEEIEPHKDYETGVTSTYLTSDLLWAGASLLQGRPPIRDWLSPWTRERTFLDFSMEDPNPWVMSLLQDAQTIRKQIESMTSQPCA